MSHVHQFYSWAKRQGLVAGSPIPLRVRRPPPNGTVVAAGDAMVPATIAHDERGERIEWLPPASYRLWRDVGVRGYGADGLPRADFRGRWSARNAVFTDLMVRTGMRLQEQSSLLVCEVARGSGAGGYRRFWLPAAIAKGGSARWSYVPRIVEADLNAYREEDRAEVVAHAQARRRYDTIRRPLVVPDPQQPFIAVRASSPGRSEIDVGHLRPAERHRLLRDSGEGLEPAMLWLGESGMPLRLPTWKSMFGTANERCRREGVAVACHAHMLRHTFAVVTLEQLQRGHIAALGELNPDQRGHYTRIFGDPLDWVRRRLGHASVLSTVIYLHALQELEMVTRMALVGDQWQELDDPRVGPFDEAASEDGIAGKAGR